ncbi:hypothetical protein ACC718_38195, partial [Rhizobium ruizarguesonis]
ARTTTLINISRALGLELMLIPQAMIPAVDALLQPDGAEDDLPAFMASAREMLIKVVVRAAALPASISR